MRASALIPLLPLLALAAPAPPKQQEQPAHRPSLNFGPIVASPFESFPEGLSKRSVSEDPVAAATDFLAARVGELGVDFYVRDDVSSCLRVHRVLVPFRVARVLGWQTSPDALSCALVV